MEPIFSAFNARLWRERRFAWGDGVIILTLLAFAGLAIHLAYEAPQIVKGPTVSLSLTTLPLYAVFSMARMLAAYILSLTFTFLYGYAAAYSPSARKFLMPLLDVLQSVPILSFLPVVLLTFTAVMPQRLAIELASIVLIFTSQVWNLTFAWYQSLITEPKELREASTIFRFNKWLRFKTLDFPFATISLIWNSMMSWAGGWFFLMAAEIFTVGSRDFRLPGLGAYLKEAATQGDLHALSLGMTLLILIIVGMDQLIWRPLLAWSDRRKLEMTSRDMPPSSWFYQALIESNIIRWLNQKIFFPMGETLDRWFVLYARPSNKPEAPAWRRLLVKALLLIFAVFALSRAFITSGKMLYSVTLSEWLMIFLNVGATFLRVVVALILAFAWTIPVGVAIGTNPKLARWFQPLVQIAASVPATALFPAFLMFLLHLPAGLNIAAILLMLLGTQWYLLFNVIAGANAIPQELKYMAALLHLSRFERWRTLILPALYPYLITGAITAGGGAWNASIVAEYVEFGGQTLSTHGVGALIAKATASGNYPLLFSATFSMVLTVAMINRQFWRRLFRLAEEKYRMD